MNLQALAGTAGRMVAGDNGLLAMDESNPTCNKRSRPAAHPGIRRADGNLDPRDNRDEPVWAIGSSGHQATPLQAQDAHALIRRRFARMYGEKSAQKLAHTVRRQRQARERRCARRRRRSHRRHQPACRSVFWLSSGPESVKRKSKVNQHDKNRTAHRDDLSFAPGRRTQSVSHAVEK
jgi:hypothetical protein